VTSKSIRMPEQSDCPTAANTQFDRVAIESWETEGVALSRHTPAGNSGRIRSNGLTVRGLVGHIPTPPQEC
jgi:hypothetical protein